MSATRTRKMSWKGGTIRRLTAIVCVLWLGGVGCALGCGTAVFDAAAAGTDRQVETDTCPVPSGDEHCCHRAKTVRHAAPVEMLSPAPVQMNCCPLAGQTAVQSRAIRFAYAPAAVVASWNPSSATPLDTTTNSASTSGRRRVPDRGSTRLRCCVFLI